MAVEVANITLWLASFVPGLALSWLDGNLKCGNSLIGVADVGVVARGDSFMFSDPVTLAMDAATAKHRELAGILDQTPDEVQRSREVAAELTEITSGLHTVFNLWAAEPFGLEGARRLDPTAVLEQRDQLSPANQRTVARSADIAEDHQFFHWSLEFPSIFHRDRPGFDVLVGNPPWEEVKLEELGFYALRAPGLHGVNDGQERRRRIAKLDEENPDWRAVLHSQQKQLATARRFLSRAGGYELQGGGDTDLYQLFCERYTGLVRPSGRLGVVLPRSALVTQGAEGFRHWLLSNTTVRRVDVIKNSKKWAFPITAQYTIALLTMHSVPPQSDSVFETTGPSASLSDFYKASNNSGVDIRVDSLGRSRLIQAQPSQRHSDTLAKIRRGTEFGELQKPEIEISRISPSAASHPVPYTELHATQQKEKFEHPQGTNRVPVWRGMSFHQYDPHGDKPAGYADWEEISEWTHLRRARARIFKRMFPERELKDARSNPMLKARIAYRAINRATDPRTIVACLVPPRTPLTNAAPYLLFRDWEVLELSAVLATLNSVTFDWQARRYVEMNINIFILNMLCFPKWDNTDWRRIGEFAARLSCVDDRFADFAAEAGVEYGPLTDAQRDDMRAEIDALVAQGYGLDIDELRFIFTDFTVDAVPEKYRELVVAKFEALL